MITILKKMPIILTQDKSFMDCVRPLQAGEVVLLPEDAILIDDETINRKAT